MSDLHAELAALRARVEALETAQGTVRAPFRVLDAEGSTVLSVEIEEDPDWGRVVRLKLKASPNGKAMLVEAFESGALSLRLADTIELIGDGVIRVCNEEGSSRAVLSATNDQSLLTLTCSRSDEMPQIQLGTSEEESHVLLVRVAEEEGVRRAGGIALFVDQQRRTAINLGRGGRDGELELRTDEAQGGRMTLRNHRGEALVKFPQTPQ